MFSQLIVLVILILLNAYFAASEIAFISLNDAKVEKQAKEGNKKAKQIEKMLKEPSKFLATIQIGITLAGFLSSAFASDTFADMLAPVLNNLIPAISLGVWRSISIIIITIILSFFTLVFGELVPKRLAMKHYEKISYATIGVIRGISIVTAPFVKLLTVVTNAISKVFGVGENEEETVTEEEIKMMVNQGEEKGTIKEEEKELINNVFEFNDITVSEIMRHRKDIFAVDINISNEELLDELSKEEYRYSRIPVYDETIDEIKGILYVKDVLKNINKKSFKVKNVVKEAYFISQNRLINEVFKELQKNKMQIAIIVDEYGGTSGIVTDKDIYEELFGSIKDEIDDVSDEYIVRDDHGNIHDSGKTTLYDFERYFHTKLKAFEDSDIITIGGYMMEHYPNLKRGESVDLEGFKFKLVNIEQGFMRWFIVSKIDQASENDDSENSDQNDKEKDK